MAKRIFWKKGMRLTDDVLRMSDECTCEQVRYAYTLAAAGRYGLFPNARPFKVEVEINKNIVEVLSIDCLGLTRDGSLIDVRYDTHYTDSFDARAVIQNASEDKHYYLCIVSNGEWKDTNEGYIEPEYTYIVLEERSSVPANALPIARLVFDEYSWRIDDIDFVPPCLFVSSSVKFLDLADRFEQQLMQLDRILPQRFVTESKDALKIFWPTVQQLVITMNKERDIMTPMGLFANIQKCVSSFVCGCMLDEYITLGDPEVFANYVRSPYNCQDVYQKIREGLELCASIAIKVEGFEPAEPEKPTAPKVKLQSPTISSDQLIKRTSSNRISLQVTNVPPSAVLLYSTDGTEPHNQAKGSTISVPMHFNNRREYEPDQMVNLRIKVELNGASSDESSYTVSVAKDWKNIIEI